jgi:ABC-type transport system involved in cytochrome bd biosynthesis fused ATPase/permease subunit
LSVGQLIAFNMIANLVTSPIMRLAQMWQEFQQVGISVKRLGDVLNAPTEPSYRPGQTTLSRIAGAVTFEGVEFRYRVDGPEVLRKVSFDVSAGAMVGIVGASGSGKSTITKLVQRLYVPEKGRVMVDGIDLARWIRPGSAAKSGWCCKRTTCSTAPSARTLRWPIRGFQWTGSCKRRSWPARTTSSWSCRRGTTRSSAR